MKMKRKQSVMVGLAVLAILMVGLACQVVTSTPQVIVVTATGEQPSGPAAPPPQALPTSPPVPTVIPSATLPTEPMLYLDKNYFCRTGPAKAYSDVTDFDEGTRLPIIGTDGNGWWLVKIDLSWTRKTSCWIGGGVPEGDVSRVPLATAPPAVAVHNGATWKVVGYLSCTQLDHYNWEIGGGAWVSTTPIFGTNNPSIVGEEIYPYCPDFSP